MALMHKVFSSPSNTSLIHFARTIHTVLGQVFEQDLLPEIVHKMEVRSVPINNS